MPRLSKLDREFLDKLDTLINDNMTTAKIDMAFLTDNMFMSHSTFYRKVKGLTGMTPVEYVRKVKLGKSIELLKSRDYSIAEISYMTGFNSPAHYREAFKDEYGMSPSQFLKNNWKIQTVNLYHETFITYPVIGRHIALLCRSVCARLAQHQPGVALQPRWHSRSRGPGLWRLVVADGQRASRFSDTPALGCPRRLWEGWQDQRDGQHSQPPQLARLQGDGSGMVSQDIHPRRIVERTARAARFRGDNACGRRVAQRRAHRWDGLRLSRVRVWHHRQA